MSTNNINKTATDSQSLLSGIPLNQIDPHSVLKGSRADLSKKATSAAFMAARPPTKAGPKPGPVPAVIDPNQVSFDFAAQPVNDNSEIPSPPIPFIDVLPPAPAEATQTPPAVSGPQNEIIPTSPAPTTSKAVPGGTHPSAPDPVHQEQTPATGGNASAPNLSQLPTALSAEPSPLPVPVIDGGALPPSTEAVTPPPSILVREDTPPSSDELGIDGSAADPANPGASALQPETPAPTMSPIFGYFMNFGGALKHDPIPLKIGEAFPSIIDDETAVTEAIAWIQNFIAVEDHDRLGRLQMLVDKIGPFAPLVRDAELKFLGGALALHLIIRDGYFKDLCTASGRPLFSDSREFTDAYLKFHGIGDSATRISRLMAGAKLWLLLVEAQLPPPPTLSRIESLISLPTDVAVAAYAELAAAAGNRVPSLAAIDSKADELKGKTESAGEKTALAAEKTRQITKIAAEARRLLAMIGDPTCDVPKFVTEFEELVASLEKFAAAPTSKKKAQDRTDAAAPTKPCPVTIKVNGKDLVVKLHLKDSVLATAIHVRALGKRWSKSDEQEWSLGLPPGPSARAAKLAQVCEHVTRVLAGFGYQGPGQPANA